MNEFGPGNFETIREHIERTAPHVYKLRKSSTFADYGTFCNSIYAPGVCCIYARDLGRRIEVVEPIIMKNPVECWRYAKFVIGGRWPEAEETIVGHLVAAYNYVMFVMGERWPLFEERYLGGHDDDGLISSYKECFLPGGAA